MMIPFLDVALQSLQKRAHDDFVDRLNYYYTTLILLFMAFTVSAKQYVGQPIQCWVPAQFQSSWEQYAENYCFIQDTYFLPFDEDLSTERRSDKGVQISYYKWIPILLAIQAMLFYFPNTLWHYINWKMGFKIKTLLEICHRAAFIFDKSEKQRHIKMIVNLIKQGVKLRQSTIRQSLFKKNRLIHQLNLSKQCRITGSYLLIKLLYAFNILFQLLFMNSYLSTTYNLWGIGILNDLLRGRKWSESGHFPRVTLYTILSLAIFYNSCSFRCDFDVRSLGSVQRHTVQCILVINMFNEKIYIFLWFWMFLLSIVTVLNLISWLTTTLSKRYNESLVMDSLNVKFQSQDSGLVAVFVSSYLKSDGMLLLRFIQNHSGELLMTEVIHQLFNDYQEFCCKEPESDRENISQVSANDFMNDKA